MQALDELSFRKLVCLFFAKLVFFSKPDDVYDDFESSIPDAPIQAGIVALLVLSIIEPLRKAVAHYV